MINLEPFMFIHAFDIYFPTCLDQLSSSKRSFIYPFGHKLVGQIPFLRLEEYDVFQVSLCDCLYHSFCKKLQFLCTTRGKVKSLVIV